MSEMSPFDRAHDRVAAFVKRLHTNDAYPFTLWVGGTRSDAPRIHHVAWSDVPASVPLSFQFSRIVVVPEAKTDELQLKLIEKLKAEIILTTQSRPRVVWILNEHVAAGVPNAVNAGSLTPFQPVVSGSVEMLIGARRRVAANVAQTISVGPAALIVACWRSDDSRIQVPVGVLSRDLQWCFVPPHPEAERIVNRLGFLRQYAVILTCVLLAAGALYKVQHRTAHDRLEYHRSIGELGRVHLRSSISSDRDPSDEGQASSTELWKVPERNLAEALFFSSKPHLMKISADLSSEQNPYELWSSKKTDSIAYFDLAVMSGDLVSAYRIAKESHALDIDRDEWSRHLTSMFWQTALQAAHELDFANAKRFTDFYLACIDAVMVGATSPDDLAPERNRTLARILQRELTNGRISALCTQPGVEKSFGHLLGGDWGKSLPEKDAFELDRRRQTNASVNCSNMDDTKTIDYTVLAELARYPTMKTAGKDPCVIAPLECEFMTIREHLGNRMPGSSRDALEFASKCSYLSDDLIYMAVVESGFDEKGIGKIPVGSLQRAMSCLERAPSDYASIITEDLGNTDCQNLDWSDFTTAAPLHTGAIRQLIARCRRTAK